VFGNRVLKKIAAPKSENVTGRWRNLHNKELRDKSSSIDFIATNKSRRMRHVGVCGMHGGEETSIESSGWKT
jgi:hypothetical protein